MKLNLFKVALVATGWVLMIGNALAEVPTHEAKIDLELREIDEQGKEKRIESKNANLSLNWITRDCRIETRQSQYECVFDTSQDIVDSKGELVMKSLPQIKIDGEVIKSFLKTLIMEDDYKVKNQISFIRDLSRAQRPVFDLPFYRCIDCESNGHDLRLFNAFYGSIENDFIVEHPALGKKKLKFLMRLKQVEVIKGAFFIIGNDNAAQYGQ